MKYTGKYFRDRYPDWKRKKDSFTARYFYRPISFYFTAAAANLGLTSNQVSYASSLVAVMACALFFVDNFVVHIIAAILFNIWLIIDCIDGNLARSVKKLPFGEFADAMGSYLLVGLMGVALGWAAYREGGIFFSVGNPWLIVIGALASSSDSLMRLIYQKYKSVERELVDEGRIRMENDVFKNPDDARNIKVRIGFEFGIGGIIPIAVLLATIFHALDLIIIYCLCYYGGACIFNILIYARKAIKREREIVMSDENAEE